MLHHSRLHKKKQSTLFVAELIWAYKKLQVYMFIIIINILVKSSFQLSLEVPYVKALFIYSSGPQAKLFV